MGNKKLKEINLVPDYSDASFPTHRRNHMSMGAPNMSADQHYSRTVMSRVNKNQELEEEIDEFVEDIELVKEFLSPQVMDTVLGGVKTGFMSIPVIGDAFAFGKFMFTAAKLRRSSRKFTHKLSKLTGVDLGDDFLEPEGTMIDSATLDTNLAEALNRITNLSDYPDIRVTSIDIKNLESKFVLTCKYVKDAIMEFIGFADFAFGQKGFFVNMGINFVTFSKLPDFLTGEYASFVNEMSTMAKAKEGDSFTSLRSFFGSFLSALSYL